MMNQISDTTKVALRDHIESRLQSIQRESDIRLMNLEKVFSDYRAAIVIEFQKVNEFRKTLGDVVEFQASSKELSNVLAQMQSEVKNMRERVDEKAGRVEIEAKLDAVGVSLRALERAQSIAEGRASQSSVLWVGLATVASLVLGVIGLLK